MKNKKIRLVISAILVILACVAAFYTIFIVEEIMTPKKLCATLQEAIDADKEFAGYTEILTQSETNKYTLVIVRVPGDRAELEYRTGVFLKNDRGWIAPAKGIFPYSIQSADVGDTFCSIRLYRVIGASGYCIQLNFPDEPGDAPILSDSMNSDFGIYSYQSVPNLGYTAWAILPELPDGYTVYVNQEPIVVK